MTAVYFGINHGDNEYQAATSATTTNKDIEIVINDVTKVPSVEELHQAIDKLENFILRSGKVWG